MQPFGFVSHPARFHPGLTGMITLQEQGFFGVAKRGTQNVGDQAFRTFIQVCGQVESFFHETIPFPACRTGCFFSSLRRYYGKNDANRQACKD